MVATRGLSLGTKFAAAFAALFLVVAGVGLSNAHQMRAVSAAAAEIEGEWLPSIQALAELKLMFTRARLIGARVIATADPAERKVVNERRQSFHRWVAEASARYEGVIKTAEERALHDRFVAAWRHYVEHEEPLLAAPYGDAAAINGFNFAAQRRYAATLEALDGLTELNRRRVADAVAAGAATYRRALWLTGSMTLLAAALALGAAFWLHRTVVSRVVRLAGAMRSLARRDYAFALPEAGGDEVGDMARAVEECRRGLQAADALAAARRAAEQARAEAEAARGRAEAELRLARQRERAERDLRLQHVRFGAALDNMSQGLCMFDAHGRLVVANGRFAELFGLPEPATQGVTFAELAAGLEADGRLAPGDVEAMRRQIETLLAGRRPTAFVWELADGRALSVSLSLVGDQGWLATYQDVTESRRAEARIAHMAHHDALTGLPNRVLFRRRLEEALARARRGEAAAVLCLDLDRFKHVNDTLGHPVGDALLRAVTERLLRHVRDADTVARLGGDEFAIVQTGAGQPEGAAALAARLVEALGAPYEIDGHQVVVGASVGIAVVLADGEDPDALLKHADMALYRAKGDGRGTHRFFEPGMDAHMQARRALELDLRRALALEEFELHYQPVVHLRSGAVAGFEALVRWRHPERGLVPPGEFIPLAEEIGLIVPLGAWVLQRACADAAEWPAPTKVAVNLSPAQFAGRGPVPAVAAALAASGLAPGRLELEITETAMLADTEATLTALRGLKALGVGVAMDDFGTGYSSLSYLRKFPFDRVKIDRSFVQDMGRCGESEAIVRAVADLCETLGMATTAEGVETEAQLSGLRAGSCTDAQGYLFSPPRPEVEVPRLHREIEVRLTRSGVAAAGGVEHRAPVPPGAAARTLGGSDRRGS